MNRSAPHLAAPPPQPVARNLLLAAIASLLGHGLLLWFLLVPAWPVAPAPPQVTLQWQGTLRPASAPTSATQAPAPQAQPLQAAPHAPASARGPHERPIHATASTPALAAAVPAATSQPAQAPISVPEPAPVSSTSASPGAHEQASASTHPEPRQITSISYAQRPAPVYPASSRQAGESGRTTLRVLVDEQGLARDIQISRSSGHARLDEAAMQAVRQARFHPYREQGQARAAWAPVSIEFQLED